jgi:hypothetical protein
MDGNPLTSTNRALSRNNSAHPRATRPTSPIGTTPVGPRTTQLRPTPEPTRPLRPTQSAPA